MSFTKFFFRPGKGEQIETTVRLLPDSRSAVYGTIRDAGGAPIRDAAVFLFESPEEGEPRLVSRMFTDERGQFLFGPLDPGTLYLAEVFSGELRVRQLE